MPIERYTRVVAFNRVPLIHPALVYDDGEAAFLWNTDGTGTDWTAEHDPSAAFVQNNGILLKTKATTPAVNDYVRIYRGLWCPPQQIVRLQLVWAHPAYGIAAHLRFVLHWYRGTVHYIAGMRSQPNNGEVARATGISGIEPTWTVMPDLSVPQSDGLWNKLDFSVNWQSGKHHLLQWNEYALDLSAINVPSLDYVAAAYLGLYIELETLQLAQAQAYVDQVLLTPENP